MHSPISIQANGAPEGGQRHQTLSRNQNMEERERTGISKDTNTLRKPSLRRVTGSNALIESPSVLLIRSKNKTEQSCASAEGKLRKIYNVNSENHQMK